MTSELTIEALTPFIGAEIIGVDLRRVTEELLQTLYCTASSPELQCRFRWKIGSLAFWDNRACQHYASSDYFPQVRKMERVIIAGNRPYYRAA